MTNVRRIIILYPGETSSERVSKPGNYSLSRLLILLHERGDPPIYLLNQSARHEQYGNIEFIHFTLLNFIKLIARVAFRQNTLIISQTGAYHRCAQLLRALMPRSRVLIRLGGVYFGKEYLESHAFQRVRRAHRRRLSSADMIISTADGTPVDLYMKKVGIPPQRYKKWLNGLPNIPNCEGRRRTNRIVCIGRLHPEKGIDYVIRSFAKAAPRLRESFMLVIVGDGPERENLRKLARELAVEAVVHFTGHADDVGPHLYSAKLLVSGLGNNTLMEAIATGTPVVALELGEIRELYGSLPNVHVVGYQPGGYGRIASQHMDAVVRDTADMIVEVLNDYPDNDDVNHRTATTLPLWDRRLEAELELYEDLLAPADPA